jgi:ion channel-forming bestrophin family protein
MPSMPSKLGYTTLRKERNWFKFALRLRGSVIPSILPRTLVCGGFGILISILHLLCKQYNWGISFSLPALASIIPNVVLGLVLVFRTNTAYERFWEGRRLWGGIVNTVRNLARQIAVSIQEHDPKDRADKIAALRLLVAFAVSTKLHLRGEAPDAELSTLTSGNPLWKLRDSNNLPLEISFWISDYLQRQHAQNKVNVHQLDSSQQLVNILIDSLGGCERILKTPIPLAYAIHLKQLLLIYCLTTPFQIVEGLGLWTGFAVALISFTLFGIEEIGVEIENPFGHDANDLPLDGICTTLWQNIEDLIDLLPSSEFDRRVSLMSEI